MMVALLIVLGAASLAGIAVLVLSAKKAPEGYQSNEGFRFGREEQEVGGGADPTEKREEDKSRRKRTAARTSFADSNHSERILSRAP